MLRGFGELGVPRTVRAPPTLLLFTGVLQRWRTNPQPPLDFIMQCLPTQSFSVAAEILSCRKAAWSQSDLQLPSLQKDKIPAPSRAV